MPDLLLSERIAGCLLAGAIGDSIGSFFEGNAQTSTFELPAQLWITDDTQLTLATCEAIVENGSVEPESIARHFVRWFRSNRISGMGASTLKSISELNAGGHWALVGAKGERSAGNGAAMRIAPIAFHLDPNLETERRTIRDVCRITHHNDEAYVGALAIIRSIQFVINGNNLDKTLIEYLVDSLPDSRVRDRLADIKNTLISVDEYVSSFGATGYVVDSVPLSILASIRSENFLDTIHEIACFGGDSDTIGSIFGHIYGAAFGRTAIPTELCERIEDVPLIQKIIEDFALSSFPPK